MVSAVLLVLRIILWGWRKTPPFRKIMNFIVATHLFRRYRKGQRRLTAITSEDVYNVVNCAKVKQGYGTCIVVNCAIESGIADSHDGIVAKIVAQKLSEENFCNYYVPKDTIFF